MNIRTSLYIMAASLIFSLQALASEGAIRSHPNQEFTAAEWQKTPYSGNNPYDHNGSEMELEQHGNLIQIAYTKPKLSLLKAGVKPGAVVFIGRRNGSSVRGTAFVFKANCSPAPYVVAGEFDRQLNLSLTGFAPSRHMGCSIDGEASRPSHLVFLEAFGDE